MARVELPDGTTEDWRLTALPKGAKEGDVIRINVKGGDTEIEIDHGETDRRRNSAQTELLTLNAKSPQGDIDL